MPIVQLFRRDAPDVPFPEGTDLLQVLWCPYDHEPSFGPRPRVLWRGSDEIRDVLDRYPVLDDPPEGTVPVPCVVHPEPVTEYPGWRNMGRDLHTALWDRAARMEEQTGWSYEEHLSEAPGIKVGGYPDWVQDAWRMVCDGCGAEMDPLLTVASWEYDPGSWRSWLPVEERAGVDEHHGPFSFEDAGSAQGAAGLTLGDAGSVYVFECRKCPERPIKYGFDCS
ncbi:MULTISPECIES: DUF1963 domain-containing protein [unclassified Nocardiopsis]|uniref:DUF1963 domain-containing protein n=1 Tax=unclassified Nocardiopsis TaxID=2649073 RepID=UPI001F5BBDE2|nr:DUF1963 domain-containing protein [Nocardiopsis sp. TSRI0078]